MSKLKSLILASLLAMPGAAMAQGKYKRDTSSVKVDVKLSDRVKPIQPKAQNKSEFKPELTADAVLSIEGLVSNIRNEQEAILAKLIDSTPDSEVEEKSDYYFRLGELYAKQQRLVRHKAAEASIAVDRAKTPGDKAKAQNVQKQAENTAKTYLLKAVKTYKGLTDNDAFRNYPKMDMALFYYGYTLQGGKYMKEARAVYDKLLKNYPNSKYVPEAHLAFADYYFEAGQLADAEARYKQVLKFPKSTAYWYAMYKMGWIHLNLTRLVCRFVRVLHGGPGISLVAWFRQYISNIRFEPREV
jgi:TolA-binding protein